MLTIDDIKMAGMREESSNFVAQLVQGIVSGAVKVNLVLIDGIFE
jgi:hypothetical protein